MIQATMLGIFHITSVFGAPAAGLISDRYGRRAALWFGSAFFIAGALIEALCSSVDAFIAGRAVAGVGNGALCSQGTVYLVELAPPAFRGISVTMFQFFIAGGIWLCTLLNTVRRWEWAGDGVQGERRVYLKRRAVI